MEHLTKKRSRKQVFRELFRLSHAGSRLSFVPSLYSNCFRMDNGLDGLSEKSNPLLLSRLCCSLRSQLLQIAVLCRLYALSYCTPPAPPPPVYGSASTLSQHAASTSSHANESVSVRPWGHAACFKPRLCVQPARTYGSTAALAGSAAPPEFRSTTPTTASQTRGDRRQASQT